MTEAALPHVTLERRFANFRAGVAAREPIERYAGETARHASKVGA
jgi:hypothetical protein